MFRFLSGGERRQGERAVSRRANALTIVALVVVLLVSWAGLFGGQLSEPVAPSSGVAQQQEEPRVQAEAQPEKIVPGPMNIKESTAIYVFLGWLWISIVVLIYILRLKIKEADRLHSIKYFTPTRR